MDETMRNFRSRLLDLGHALRKAYAQNESGTITSVHDPVTEMYSGFDKVYAIVQSEKRFESGLCGPCEQ